MLDPQSGKELSIPKLPTGVIGDLRWHENNRDLAFSLNTAQSPSDVYSVDIQAANSSAGRYSETGGINPQSFVEPQAGEVEELRWPRDLRLAVCAQERSPRRASIPWLIVIHGGPEGQSRPDLLGRNNYLVNEMGVALIYPNVRGSTGYGKTFTQLDNGFLREDTYKDIGALFDWIGQQPDLDAKRVLVTGGSYGGHMTLAVATRYNDRIACSVDIVGMSNLVTFLEHTEAYRRDLRRVEYGDERDPKMRAYLESIAPMNHVKEITKPMMVVAGRQRSARAQERSRPDGEGAGGQWNSGVVPGGQRRRPRLRQEEERRLPVLYDRAVHAEVSARAVRSFTTEARRTRRKNLGLKIASSRRVG